MSIYLHINNLWPQNGISVCVCLLYISYYYCHCTQCIAAHSCATPCWNNQIPHDSTPSNGRPPLTSKALLPPECETQDKKTPQSEWWIFTEQNVSTGWPQKTGDWAAHIWSQKATNMSRLISNILWPGVKLGYIIKIKIKQKSQKMRGQSTNHKTFDQWKWADKSIPLTVEFWLNSRLNKDVTDFDT